MADGQTMRADLDPDQAGVAPKSAVTPVAIAVVEHEGRLLVGRRPPGVPLAGYWEFPGGKVRLGESPEAAAARECREETGLNVTIVGSYPTTVFDYPHGRVELRFYRCRLAEPEVESSIHGFRWVAPGELASLAFPPANAALLAILTQNQPR